MSLSLHFVSMNGINFYIYAIVSLIDNRIYVGMSQNVEQRIREHNAGKVSSTKHFVPWVNFFTQFAGNATEAGKLEKYYKSAAGKRRLRKIPDFLKPGSLPAC